jgi:glyoxylate reductase
LARVLVTRRLPDGGLDPLASVAGLTIVGPKPDDTPYSHDELCHVAPDCDAIVCLLTDTIDDELLTRGASHGSLKIVADVAVGYNNIDTVAAARLGVTVCNTPGVLDETTADTAFLLILAASRLASEAETDLRSGRWKGWGINQYLGVDVHGATLGIVGYGRIGRAVARRAAGFGMRVLHHARHDTGEPGFVADLDALLPQCDIVSLHTPLTRETTHLVDARRLALMRPTAILVNTARGPVVDEAALAAALQAGSLFAAGLDVYEHEPVVNAELLRAPRTVLLPHIGSGSQATRRAMAQLATSAVATLLTGGTPPNVVRP